MVDSGRVGYVMIDVNVGDDKEYKSGVALVTFFDITPSALT